VEEPIRSPPIRRASAFPTKQKWPTVRARLCGLTLAARLHLSGWQSTCVCKKKKKITLALAAWCSGHRVRPGNTRPWFESRQGASFLGKHGNAVVYVQST
jgi:hypothetical protein